MGLRSDTHRCRALAYGVERSSYQPKLYETPTSWPDRLDAAILLVAAIQVDRVGVQASWPGWSESLSSDSLFSL
jgi:hypothetical protein